MITELKLAIKNKDLKEIFRMFKFGLVGGAGVVINTAALWILTSFIGLHYLIAATIATETAIIANFIGNHTFTFADSHDSMPIFKRFLSFQAVSLITLLVSLTILYVLTSTFGESLLLVWNLVAILLTFMLNYELNKRFTWAQVHLRNEKPNPKKSSNAFLRSAGFIIAAITFTALFVGVAVAEPFSATSRLGYHPDADKQVVIYLPGDIQAGDNFTIFDGNSAELTLPLEMPLNDAGDPITCQGGVDCLVGDFSSFTDSGTFTITVDGTAVTSAPFTISDSVYEDNLEVFDDFFDAQEQVGSSFHADYHLAQSPPFTLWADGSPIMEADQASQTLIRLGYAYRENPSVFNGDLQTHVKSYARFIRGLQNVQVEQIPYGSPGWEDGFRIGSTMQVENVFVVGPTDLESVPVYTNTNGVELAGSPYAVTSICESLDPACVDFAADVYKCVPGEPCLNVTYVGPTGRITTDANDFSIRMGWNYEFACDLDVDIDGDMFNVRKNPCLIFREDADTDFTLRGLHAYLAALPALEDSDSALAQEYWYQALRTYNYIEGDVTSGDDLATWGAINFLMYDITGNEDYLQVAYGLEGDISQSFNSYISDGVEYYWTNHALHYDDMVDAGFAPINSPQTVFRGQMFFDWKDRGLFSISESGERVFQLYRDAEFQNSRPMLIQSVLASKTQLLYEDAEPFTQTIADSQLAWLTGTNAVQDGVALDEQDLRSYSFILGIGEDINPAEFHSRLLIDTGHRSRTNGEFVGARGTGYWWQDDGDEYWGFDGVTTIIDTPLGASGNGFNGETKVDKWDIGRTFANGEDTIPGWIVGPYSPAADTDDVIYNYNDDLENFRYTETTNEMVAIAMQALALRDRIYNNKAPHPGVSFDENLPVVENATLVVTTAPSEASIFLDGQDTGFDGAATLEVVPGSHTVSAQLQGYQQASQYIENIASGESQNVDLVLLAAEQSGILNIQTTPGLVDYTINSAPPLASTTAADGSATQTLVYGDYVLTFSKTGFVTTQRNVTVDQPSESVQITLIEENAEPSNLTIQVTPTNSIIAFDGGEVPSINGTARIEGIEPGEHTLSVLDGIAYEPYGPETIFVDAGTDQTISIDLMLRNSTLQVASTPTDADVYLDDVFVGITDSSISYPRGNYTMRLDLAGYESYSEKITLNAGLTTTVSHNFAPTTGSLRIFSRPGANVVVDSDFVGSVNASGELTVEGVQTGQRRVEANLEGFNTNVKNVVVAEGSTLDVNLPLTVQLDGSTDLPGSVYGADYFLREDQAGNFNVDLAANQTVQWRVRVPGGDVVTDGPDVTLNGNETFTWNPTIMWTPRLPPTYSTIETFLVEATTGDGQALFEVDVENVINPFSTNIGDREARFQVFTNDKFVSFTHVRLTIDRDDGGEYNVDLVPEGAGNNETDWKVVLNENVLGYGSNKMIRVAGYPDGLNSTPIIYPVTGRDSFFQRPSSGGSNSGGSGGGGGGGSSSSDDDVEESFELVVVTVSDDVIDDDESITISADIRASQGAEVEFANVILRHPAGWERTEDLELVSGSAGYGTWEVDISAFTPGQYVLETVRVRGDSFAWTELAVEDRGFYVVGEEVAAGERLAIVYTALDESLLSDPGTTTFRLDARDEIGVESIIAEIQSNREEQIQRVPMTLVSGDAKYGTWEMLVNASQEDTTYTISAVTLSNGDDQRRLEIPDRQVYVAAPTPEEVAERIEQEQSGLTGNVGAESPVSRENIQRLISQPMVPALLAFLVVVLVVATVFFTPLRKKFQKG